MPEPDRVPAHADASLKRLAMQLSMQLPEDHRTAMAVLSFMRDIVDWEADLVRPSRVFGAEPSEIVPFPKRA